MKIASVIARQLLDCKARPLVEVEITTDTGYVGLGASPTGTSVGAHEAFEMATIGGAGAPARPDTEEWCLGLCLEGDVARAPTPAELQQMTTYSAGVTTGARQMEAAQAFIRHLAAPAAMTIYKTKGLAL